MHFIEFFPHPKIPVDMVLIAYANDDQVKEQHRLSIPSADGTIFLNVDSVVRLQAEGSYTYVILGPDNKYVVSRNLSALEARLPTAKFFRCHHSHVINLSKVLKLVRNGGHQVLLSTGAKICVSRRKWAALVAAMDRF